MASGTPDRPPDVDLEFGQDSHAPRRARQVVRRLIQDPDDPIANAVVLCASELVSNVVRHTSDGGIMRGWDPKPNVPLRIEVEDHDPALPTVKDPPPDDPGGRGLAVVAKEADDWGVDPTDDGKVVWAEFNRDISRT